MPPRVAAALLLIPMLACIAGVSPTSAPVLVASTVNQSVQSFRNPEDFSTPPRAYAALAHRLAGGRGNLRPYSAPELVARADTDDFAPPKQPTQAEARAILTTQILETHAFGDTDAAVLARLTSGWIDVRYFKLEGGRWLNNGNDRAVDLATARRRAAEHFSALVPKPWRPKVTDPAAYLQAFVDDLKQHAQDPKQAVLASLKAHKLTMIGQVPHRPVYWALNAAVVRDPAFPKLVSTLFLELPSNDQDLVDQFLDARQYDPAPVIAALRDVRWMGCPDQALLDFFKCVWDVNHAIPPGYRLRVVLVDMPRPWAELRTQADAKSADNVDRDDLMATNIQNDFHARRGDPRHALLIAGLGRVAKNLPLAAEPAIAIDTAGAKLSRALGPENVYAFVQHSPALSNSGAVFGRAALGIFDTAFAATGNRPAAVPLKDSPFGRERFDADADLARLTSGTYADAFDAYLYLAALDGESFSAIIPGFYTDEFVKEVERRRRLMSDEPLSSLIKADAVDAKSFEAWLGKTWGKPRAWTDYLGPADAWKNGD